MKQIYKLILCSLFIFNGSQAFAVVNKNENKLSKTTETNVPKNSPQKIQKIEKIIFEGLNRVKESALLPLLENKVGEDFKPDLLEQDIQSLKNSTVFRTVTGTTQKNSDGNVTLIFSVTEKWTLIPYFVAGSGGGTSYYVFGLFDSNFLGRLYLAQFHYKLQNGNNNFFGQFRNDHTFGWPLTTGVMFIHSADIKDMYNEKNTIGHYSYQSTNINPYFLVEVYKNLKIGSGIVYQSMSKINSELSTDENNDNQINEIPTPNSFENIAFQGRLNFGEIDHDELSLHGFELTGVVNSTLGAYAGSTHSDDYTDVLFRLYGFVNTFPKNSYLGVRSSYFITSSDNFLRHASIGGLDSVRGFNDNQFMGSQVFFTNVEYRACVWMGNYVAVQLVPFFGMGKATDKNSSLFSGEMATSVGIGVHLPLVKINRLIVRMDYGWTLSPFAMNGFSFGMTQFF